MYNTFAPYVLVLKFNTLRFGDRIGPKWYDDCAT
jgi:hypothetical protein